MESNPQVFHYYIQLNTLNYAVKIGIGVYVRASYDSLWGQAFVHDDMGNLVPCQSSKVDYFTFGKVPRYHLMNGVVRNV